MSHLSKFYLITSFVFIGGSISSGLIGPSELDSPCRAIMARRPGSAETGPQFFDRCCRQRHYPSESFRLGRPVIEVVRSGGRVFFFSSDFFLDASLLR